MPNLSAIDPVDITKVTYRATHTVLNGYTLVSNLYSLSLDNTVFQNVK